MRKQAVAPRKLTGWPQTEPRTSEVSRRVTAAPPGTLFAEASAPRIPPA